MEFERLKEIIVEQLGVNENDVTSDASFENDLGANSLDLVDIVMAIEDEFGIEVNEDDIENIDTVGKAVDYIKSCEE